MQIEKINENQLEVFLDIEDLKQNNISIHSFMCNSSISQNFYLSILTFLKDNIGFKLENYEITIESFALPSHNSFVLVITGIPRKTYLKPIKSRYHILKMNKFIWLKFNNFEDFCMFCNFLKINIKIKSSLYFLDSYYFLHIKFNNFKDYLMILITSGEFTSKIYNNTFFLDENADIIIENSAVQICKKYFV